MNLLSFFDPIRQISKRPFVGYKISYLIRPEDSDDQATELPPLNKKVSAHAG